LAAFFLRSRSVEIRNFRREQMQFQIKIEDPMKYPCQALVLGCLEDDMTETLYKGVDKLLGGYLGSLYRQKEFSGKQNKTKIIHTLGRLPAERIVLVGLGKKRGLSAEKIRQAAGAAVQSMRDTGVRSIASILHLLGDDYGALHAAVEGAYLGGYSFRRYKSKREESDSIDEVTLLFPKKGKPGIREKIVRDAQALCEAVVFARDMVSQPGNVATPSFLAEKAMEMAARYGMDCRVLEREEMEQNGMGALLSVAKGSRQPPSFIILEYLPAGPKVRPTVLVGKGITFDSGGISLKPREGMEKMKDDMAGGAAVIGVLMAAAALELPVNLVGLVPAAENLPGGDAFKPGDVVKSMSGQTIEIVNTDAEGRMILCDALYYAKCYKPSALIDLATLTGACVVALGSYATGLFGNDEGLKRALRKASDKSGERVWELPLWEEYGELIKSDIADMKNAGGPEAGAISAGCFLKGFVGNTRWAHLDIAGTAWMDKDRPYMPKGATGVGIRLIIEYLKGVAKG
jgi:leucyl aminopeptidase